VECKHQRDNLDLNVMLRSTEIKMKDHSRCLSRRQEQSEELRVEQAWFGAGGGI
jgi:hypothetical protein